MKLHFPEWLGLAIAGVIGWFGMGWIPRKDSPSRLQTQPTSLLGRSVSTDKSRHWFAAIQAERDPARRTALALAMARRTPPSEIKRLLESMGRFPVHSGEELLIRVLLQRWQEQDPKSAIQWSAAHRPAWMEEVAEHWFRRDPKAMLRFAKEKNHGLGQQRLVGVAVKVLAETDFDGAFALIKEHRESFASGGLGGGLEQLAKLDHRKLLSQAEELPAFLRRQVDLEVAPIWAAKDLDGAVAWARENPDPNLLRDMLWQASWERVKEILPTLTSTQQKVLAISPPPSWLGADPAAFLQSVDEMADLVDGGVRDQLRGNAMYGVLEKDPKLAAQWINENPEPEKAAQIIRHGITQLGMEDLDQARDWASSLADPKARAIAEEALGQAESRLHPVRTPEGLADLLANGKRLDSQYLLSLDGAGHSELLERIDRLPQGVRDKANQAYFKQLTDAGSHEAASKLLFRQSLPEDKLVEETAKLTSSWAFQEPAAAAKWVASLPSGSAKEWAIRNAAAQWSRINPAAAQAWASSLPEGVERQTALGSLSATTKP